MESHPDDQLPDLRLLSPFPELVDYCSKQDLSSMTKKDHMHTPWLVVLYHAVEEWKRTHDGETPKNYKEKQAFKQILRDMNLKTEEGVPEHEDNFEEALRHVNTALQRPTLPSDIKGGYETGDRLFFLGNLTESRIVPAGIYVAHDSVSSRGYIGYMLFCLIVLDAKYWYVKTLCIYGS